LHCLWIEIGVVLLEPTQEARQLGCAEIQIGLKNHRRRHVLGILRRVASLG